MHGLYQIAVAEGSMAAVKVRMIVPYHCRKSKTRSSLNITPVVRIFALNLHLFFSLSFCIFTKPQIAIPLSSLSVYLFIFQRHSDAYACLRIHRRRIGI